MRARPPVPPALAATMARLPRLGVSYYEPARADAHHPHDRGEFYLIAGGAGVLRVENQRHHFTAGDVFYVPAEMAHHFEEISRDFATWVIFFEM